MKWFCISSVFLISVLPYGHGYYGSYRDSSREEENSRKLSKLEKQVEVLTNELKSLKEDVKVLKGEPTPSSDPDILPLKASRTMRPGGRVRFTLQYKAKPAIIGHVRLFWMDTEKYLPIQESVSNEIPRLPADVYESSIEIEASETTFVSVTVGTMEFWYRLEIKNALEGNAIQYITSLPEAQIISPLGDIVYEPGTNASLRFVGPIEEESPGNPGFPSVDNMDIQFFINPPDSDDVLEKYGRHDFVDDFVAKGEEKIFFDKKEFSIVFNTSVIAYSGFVLVTLGQTDRNDLVYRVEKNYMIPLRPSSQSGAFREGLLTFLNQTWLETTANGDFVESCSPGELCRIYCQVFGNNQNQVVMLRTVNGIVETVIPTSQDKGEFLSYALYNFYMTSNPNTINFTCVATNTGGQRAISTYMVHLHDPPTFVDEQTTIKVSPEDEVNVTCTATGSPLPQINITFPLPKRMEFEDIEENLEVLYQTNDTISVSKVVNLRDFSSDSDLFSYLAGFAYCDAFNSGGTNSRHLYLHDSGNMTIMTSPP